MPSGRREQTLRFLAAPTDAGYSGSVSGGRVLEWIDKAGFACAVARSGTYCVTAYVGNVRFTRPVDVGDLVESTARLVHPGTSSMHIVVRVRSGSPRDEAPTPATECLMVFVAVEENGRPTGVPGLDDGDEDDSRFRASAVRRIGLRSDIVAAMGEQTYSAEGTAPRSVLRFLAAPTDVNWGGKVHGGIVMRWINEGAHVSVHVRSGDPATGDVALTTHCLIVFVSVGQDGLARRARAWEPLSQEDIGLHRHARHLIDLRAETDRPDDDPAFRSVEDRPSSERRVGPTVSR